MIVFGLYVTLLFKKSQTKSPIPGAGVLMCWPLDQVVALLPSYRVTAFG